MTKTSAAPSSRKPSPKSAPSSPQPELPIAHAKKRHVPQPADFTPEYVTNVSEAIYRVRLGKNDVAQMIAEDKDGGQKLRRRAMAYDSLTRDYLKLLTPKGKPP